MVLVFGKMQKNLVLSANATSTLLVAFLFFGQIGQNRQWQGERYPLHTTPKKTRATSLGGSQYNGYYRLIIF